jgi:hypothetical protein
MRHGLFRLWIPTTPAILSVFLLTLIELFLRMRGIGYDIVGPLLLLGVVASSVFVEGVQGYYTALGISVISSFLSKEHEQNAVWIFGVTTLGVSFCIARLKYLRSKAQAQNEKAQILYHVSRDLIRETS